jgi:Domain of unknown function (DUF4124)
MRSILLAMIVLIGLALPAGAEMYKWVDEKGTVHFTDDPSTGLSHFQATFDNEFIT